MSLLDVTKILEDKGYNDVSDNDDVVTSLKGAGYIPFDTPEVPSSVKDWIRTCKQIDTHEVSLSFALNPGVWEINRLSNECQEWLHSADNQKVFALLWISQD